MRASSLSFDRTALTWLKGDYLNSVWTSLEAASHCTASSLDGSMVRCLRQRDRVQLTLTLY